MYTINHQNSNSSIILNLRPSYSVRMLNLKWCLLLLFFVLVIEYSIGYISHVDRHHQARSRCSCPNKGTFGRKLDFAKFQKGFSSDGGKGANLEECVCESSYYANPSIEGGVWPLPQKIGYSAANRTVRRDGISFAFRGVRDVDCDILKNAIDTYTKKWLFPTRLHGEKGGSLTVIIRMHKKCPKLDEFPQQDMDEEYFVRVPSSGDATIEANEIWGILRGLETFSQLIFRAHGSYFVRTVNIHDWPEYLTRGIMIDTARHYLRKNIILRQIDLMAQNKMNLLHWHIVDMESFPYVSKAFANLSIAGAYSPKHVYSPNTVREIIRYGRLRGVRVMVEFDTPGHMSSWFGQPELLAECHDPLGKIMPPALIDPSVEKNYNFLKNFFSEILDVFPEKFIHLGGDETYFWINECWVNNSKIAQFMKEHELNDTYDLAKYYNVRLTLIIKDLLNERDKNKGNDSPGRYIFWDEIYHEAPDTNAIIHVWTSPNQSQLGEYTANITAAGYNVLVSSCWYLNYVAYGADWMSGDTYHNYYACDPRNFVGTDEQKELVLGGLAAMWGEFVDGTNIEARLWPRASAVAERLWSAPEATKHANEAVPRLYEHRCRMVARGYRAQPFNGADSCPFEYDDEV